MMRRLIAMLAAAAAGLPAYGAEGFELSLRSRGQAATAAPAAVQHRDAPFRTGRDPLPLILLAAELESRGPRGACENVTTDLCYDLTDRRVVYRRARAYMPKIEGLQAESVSLKRDRIIFKYSF